ncbi:MAG: hypothetical protein WC815_05265 [Vicinamibacterales bacterium]|jgi:hypothetical protein
MPRPAVVAVILLSLAAPVAGQAPRLFFLDLRGKLVSATPHGTDRQVVIDGLTGQPDGIAVNRASMDGRRDKTTLAGGFNETIGIALDLEGGRMFLTDLRGGVYSLKLDGSDRKTLFTGQGMLTGIAYAELTRTTANTPKKQD